MIDVRILTQVDSVAWDALAAHPMQSYAWGKARAAMGTEVVHIATYEGSNMRAVYLLTLHPIPHTRYKIGYIARSGQVGAEVLDFLYAWARDKGVLSIKFEPYISFDAVGALATHLHVVRSSMPLFTEWNLEVSLAGDAAALLSRYAKNTRNSIRAAERAGVAVSASTEDTDFEIFLDLYFKTCARQNYHGHTRAYHRTLWHTLRDAGIARVYIARYNNAPHTACMVFTWHDTAFYPYAGNSGEHRSVAAGQLLVARVLEDAQRAGLRAVDLWGALPPDHNSNHPWSGFTYFKKGFGAEYVHLSPSFDLIAQPLGYMLYRLAYRLRALWFKL